jgi:hypothetical protein
MCADRPQDCPDSRHDRREFLKATAAISAAMIAAPALGADGESTPGDSAPMPQITLGKHSVSRLIVGCHNIDGGSHMSPFMDKEMHEYYTSERAVQTLRHCEDMGINAWQSHQQGTLLGIFNRLRQAGGKMQMLGLTQGEEDLREAAELEGLIGVAHHGEVTDAVIVGIYDRYSDQAAQNAALARRFGARA